MKSARATSTWVPSTALLCLLCLLPMGAFAGPDEVVRSLEQQLLALDQPRMYISVDKPLYQPGETLWMRLWEVSLKTAHTGNDHDVTIQLVDPRGSNAAELLVRAQGGVATSAIDLPAGLAGGEYLLRASSSQGGTVERPIIVSSYESPQLKKKLEFLRKAYGPGDTVSATVKLERGTGEPLAGAAFTALVLLNDAELERLAMRTDAKGEAIVRFALPGTLGRGDGLLTILVDDAGVTESIQKRIPIVLETIDVGLFPEGGDLVAGLPSRVYVRARNALGKPVDFEAVVLDGAGKELATVRSVHAGMGRFELTPKPGVAYTLKITKPTSVRQQVSLPAVLDAGCTLRTADDYLSQEPLVGVRVACTEGMEVVVAAVLRGQLVGHAGGTVGRAGATLPVAIPPGAQGALRVTLFDGNAQPMAERLVYRGLASDVQLELVPDKQSYTPREQVTLTLSAKTKAGAPVQGDFALSVVDDTVLSFADDKTGHILSTMLLTPEMPGQVIDEPNFYFSDDPKAPEAMDLLLGTQGWRHFTWEWVVR